MANKNRGANEIYVTNNADGFTLTSGDTTERSLTVSGADVSFTGSGSNTYTMPAASDTLVGRASTDTLTNKTIDGDSNTLSNLDIGNEVDWAAIGDVADRTAFASGDKVLIFEAGVGMRKVDYDDFPGVGGGISNVVEDTTPQLGGQLDVNGNAIGDGTNELLTFVEDASAVNHIEIENNATGSAPIIRAAGDDTNIDLELESKGTGAVVVPVGTFTQRALEFTGTTVGFSSSSGQLNMFVGATPALVINSAGDTRTGTSDNHLLIGGSNAAGDPDIAFQSDTDTGMFRVSADVLGFATGGTEAVRIDSGQGVQFNNEAYFDAEVDNGNSGAADTIDWTAGNKQASTLTDNCNFTFSPEPSGPCNLMLKLTQDATGSRTVTWPADVNWAGGTAPTLSTAANAVDLISFYYDGTDFYGQSALNFS